MTDVSSPSGNIKTIRNFRRLSQLFFLFLFILLIYLTEFSFTSGQNSGDISSPSKWLNLFYNLDPLSGLVTGISAWTMLSILLLGIIIIIGTSFFGRFFCGWVCPLGTLNHAMSSFKSERKSRKGKSLIESNKYHRYQGWKYYIFFGIVALSIAGSVQIGLFDPIAIAGRSIGMVLIPAINSAINGLAGWFSQSPVTVFRLLGSAIYGITSGIITYFKQPHFHGMFWLALIFILILIGNRIFTRFWCRGFCPLGAFLDIERLCIWYWR